MPIVIVALVVLLSGGVSIGAQNSLPGDALYPVKIDVNEKIGSWFNFSEKAKANFDGELALKRLDEAKRLEAKGQLDAETKAELNEAFKAKVASAEDHVAEWRTENSDEADNWLIIWESKVRIHISVLDIANLDTDLDSDGQIDVDNEGDNNEGDNNDDRNESVNENIKTEKADLQLNFQAGLLTLSGTLMRSTPCINWSVVTTATKDFPPSQVTFSLTKRSTSEICIQVLGKPQEVKVSSPSSAKAKVIVQIEGITVFTGNVADFK